MSLPLARTHRCARRVTLVNDDDFAVSGATRVRWTGCALNAKVMESNNCSACVIFFDHGCRLTNAMRRATM